MDDASRGAASGWHGGGHVLPGAPPSRPRSQAWQALRRRALGLRLALARHFPGLEPTGAPTANPAALRAYLRDTVGRRIYGPAYTPAGLREVLVHEADTRRILASAAAHGRNRFQLFGATWVDAGPVVDWHRDYLHGAVWPRRGAARALREERAGRDPQAVWELNRQQHLTTLAVASLLSGEPRHAAAAARHLETWLAQNPPGLGVNWLAGFEIALRLVTWLWALPLLAASEAFPVGLLAPLVRSAALQARRIAVDAALDEGPSVAVLGEALGLFAIGLALRELPGAGAWRRQGLAVLEAAALRQVGDDGLHRGASLYDHCYALEALVLAAVLGERNGAPLSAGARARIERMAEALQWLARPDGSLPRIGDGDSGRVLRLGRPTYADVRDLLCLAAILFDRGDFAASAGRFAEAAAWLWPDARRRFEAPGLEAPASGWRLFPQARLAVDRRLWRGDARHLILDAGELGDAPVSHGHAGCLGIHVFALGRPLIVDPGTYVYRGAPAWREYFRNTRAHSTVLVDEREQAVSAGAFGWATRYRSSVHRALATHRYSLVTAEHDGYASLPRPVIHRRTVVSVDGEYWLCLDAILGSGGHDLQFLFHFPAGTRVAAGIGGHVVATLGERQRLQLTPLGFAAVGAQIVEGREDPIQGWESEEYGTRRPAPVLVHWTRAPAPAVRGHVLWPTAEAFVPDFRATGTQRGSALTAVVTHGPVADLVCVAAAPSAAFIEGDVEFVGQFLHLRAGGDGRPVRLLACGVTELRWSGHTLFEADRPVDWISAAREREEVVVSAAPSAALPAAVLRRASEQLGRVGDLPATGELA